jgi:hypothetical protein
MSPHEHGRGMVVGLVLALAAWPLWLLMDDEQHRLLAGLLLAGIGTAYVGFAIADGRTSAIVVQSVGAVVFILVAYAGVQTESDLVLGLGFLGHGAWDWLHHSDGGPTHVRTWYPPFCAVADVTLALPLLLGLV